MKAIGAAESLENAGALMAAKRYELSDTHWEQIKDLTSKAKTGRPTKDDRMMLNAMFWLSLIHI